MARRLGLIAISCVVLGLVFSGHPEPACGKKPVFMKDYETEHHVYELLKQAQGLEQAGKNIEAKSLLMQAARYDPTANSGAIHRLLSYIYERLGSLEKAIVECHIALRFEPDVTYPMFTIATCYADLGNHQQAISWAQNYIATKPARARKEKAEDFIADLTERAASGTKADPRQADYFAELQAEDDVHPWLKAKLPIKVFIADGTGMTGYQPVFRQVAFESLNAWVKASGYKLGYVLVNDPSSADLNLQWVHNIDSTKKSRYTDKLGLTTYEGKTGTPWQIESATVQIRLLDPFHNKPLTDDEIKETCLHEFGHALGLCGHSSNTVDIMASVENSRQLPGLTRRDKATIARIYADYPAMQQPAAPGHGPGPAMQTGQGYPPAGAFQTAPYGYSTAPAHPYYPQSQNLHQASPGTLPVYPSSGHGSQGTGFHNADMSGR